MTYSQAQIALQSSIGDIIDLNPLESNSSPLHISKRVGTLETIFLFLPFIYTQYKDPEDQDALDINDGCGELGYTVQFPAESDASGLIKRDPSDTQDQDGILFKLSPQKGFDLEGNTYTLSIEVVPLQMTRLSGFTTSIELDIRACLVEHLIMQPKTFPSTLSYPMAQVFYQTFEPFDQYANCGYPVSYTVTISESDTNGDPIPFEELDEGYMTSHEFAVFSEESRLIVFYTEKTELSNRTFYVYVNARVQDTD